MNNQEQKEFIESMCDNLKKSMLENTDKIPNNWDGYELRQYLVDSANMFLFIKMDKSRKRDYNNDISIYNL